MAKTSSFFDDANDPAKITQIIKDAAKYLADDDTKYFDASGFCGLPIDTYNAAAYRMGIQINKDKSKKEEEPQPQKRGLFKRAPEPVKDNSTVEIYLEIILSDGSWSDKDATGAVKIIPAQEFISMDARTFFNDVTKALHNKMMAWEDSTNEEKSGSSCKDIIYKIKPFKGLSSYKISQQIFKYIVGGRYIDKHDEKLKDTLWYLPKNATAEQKDQYNTRMNNAVEQVGRAIDLDDERTRTFFDLCVNENNPKHTLKQFLENFIATFNNRDNGLLDYISSDEVVSKSEKSKKNSKEKLPTHADTADEIVSILKKAKGDPRYRRAFTQAVASLVPEVKDTEGTDDDLLVKALLNYFKSK